jgi:predicted RecA/RadA family phage recombinase
MNNFSHQGDTVTVIAPYNCLSGTGVLVGTIFGITANDQIAGDSTELARRGVFSIAKDANACAQGARAHWDDVNKVVTALPTTFGSVGYFETAALAGDATVPVVLSGAPTVAGGLNVAHAIYNFAVDGGASCTPVFNSVIPANAIIIGVTINSTTAALAAGAATVGIGTTAGSTTTSLLAATAKTSLTIDALLAGVPTRAAPIKMTAAGSISFLIATGPLTAGIIEVFVEFVVPNNA